MIFNHRANIAAILHRLLTALIAAPPSCDRSCGLLTFDTPSMLVSAIQRSAGRRQWRETDDWRVRLAKVLLVTSQAAGPRSTQRPSSDKQYRRCT